MAILLCLLFNPPHVRRVSLGGVCLPRFGTATGTGVRSGPTLFRMFGARDNPGKWHHHAGWKGGRHHLSGKHLLCRGQSQGGQLVLDWYSRLIPSATTWLVARWVLRVAGATSKVNATRSSGQRGKWDGTGERAYKRHVA